MPSVVTRVAKGSGNLALSLPLVEVEPMSEANDWEGRYEPASKVVPQLVLAFREPVFRVGEILDLDANDRDQFGRKPSKWDVSVEHFDTWPAAVEAARAAVALA